MILNNLTTYIHTHLFCNNMTKYILFFFLLISFLQAPLLGQNLKRKWQTIKAQADTLEAHKDFQAALPLRLQEKDIALKKWKKPSEQYATATYDLGLNYYYLAKLDSSLFFFQESLETREKMGDTNSMSYIKPLFGCARNYVLSEDYQKAAPFCERLSRITPQILPENDPTYLKILNLLAVFYLGINNDEKALAVFQKGLILSEPLLDTDHIPHIHFLINLGAYYGNHGQNNNAVPFYMKALTILEKKSLQNTAEYLTIRSNLGLIYIERGQCLLAMPIFRQNLHQLEMSNEKTSLEYVTRLQHMGELYGRIGQHDSSLRVLKQAQSILKNNYSKTPNIELTHASTQNLIAMNYSNMGKFDEALKLTQESLQVFEKLNAQNQLYYTTIKEVLAGIYLKMGRKEDALITCKTSLQIKKEFFGEVETYAMSLINISLIYVESEKYDTALICLRNALSIYDKDKERSHRHYGATYALLGEIFRRTNQYDSALLYLDKSLLINHEVSNINDDFHLGAQYSLSFLYQDLQQFPLAADYLTRNYQMLYQHYQNQSAVLTEKDRQALWETMKKYYEAFQSLCFVAKDSVPQLITKAYNNQLNTGGILLRGTENIAQAIHKNGDEKLIILYNDWLYKKNQLIDWATWDSTQRKLAAIDLKLETDKTNEMEQQLAQQSLIFRNATDTLRVQWQQVQAALQQGEVAVEIVQFREIGKFDFTDTVHYAAFILTPETKTAPIYVPLPFGNKMEGEWATEYQNHIEDSVNTLSFGRYFKPILAHIKDAKHIYFAADGIYHKINLNTLLAEDGKYLVEKYVIHRIASTRDLAKRKSAEEFPTNQTAALFGNPTFRISKVEHDSLAQKVSKNVLASANLYREIAEDRDEFSNLPAAKEEVMAVKSILEKQHFEVKTYIEKEALEEEVRNLKHPSIILFATHGGFKEESLKYKKMNNGFYNNPMYKSKLYFVGARNAALSKNDSTQTKHEDGILYAAEAALLDLQGTDLVALSACETGLGTIQNGEGVWGLQRAFRIAGAKNLIMSLWKVDDKASKEFMTTFFENWLEKKMPKYAAFQQAQLSLMEEYKNEPKKWGGFILLEGL